jgi:hypothetical protein
MYPAAARDSRRQFLSMKETRKTRGIIACNGIAIHNTTDHNFLFLFSLALVSSWLHLEC